MSLPKYLATQPGYCPDGSYVEYFLINGQEWVKQIHSNGITRYSKFSTDGKWMTENNYKQLGNN